MTPRPPVALEVLLKTLGLQHAIDAERLEHVSDAELRDGVRAPWPMGTTADEQISLVLQERNLVLVIKAIKIIRHLGRNPFFLDIPIGKSLCPSKDGVVRSVLLSSHDTHHANA